MTEESVANAIRKLTVAIWVLSIILLVNVAAGLILPWFFMRGEHSTPVVDISEKETKSKVTVSADPINDFYNWPIEKQIASATAIILTKNNRDGDKVTSTVSEILKVTPDTRFDYKVGDTYESGTVYLKKEYINDGEIVFFTGSPPTMRYSTGFSNNRLWGVSGDIPIEKVKELIQHQASPNTSPAGQTDTKPKSDLPENSLESVTAFHRLTPDEQIKKASVIALAKYEQAPDGKMKVIIKEFLKKEPGVTIYYNIGDEYAYHNFDPKEKANDGDGEVLFFKGSPATLVFSWIYKGDRIRGLADLPIELLKNKCKQ